MIQPSARRGPQAEDKSRSNFPPSTGLQPHAPHSAGPSHPFQQYHHQQAYNISSLPIVSASAASSSSLSASPAAADKLASTQQQQLRPPLGYNQSRRPSAPVVGGLSTDSGAFQQQQQQQSSAESRAPGGAAYSSPRSASLTPAFRARSASTVVMDRNRRDQAGTWSASSGMTAAAAVASGWRNTPATTLAPLQPPQPDFHGASSSSSSNKLDASYSASDSTHGSERPSAQVLQHSRSNGVLRTVTPSKSFTGTTSTSMSRLGVGHNNNKASPSPGPNGLDARGPSPLLEVRARSSSQHIPRSGEGGAFQQQQQQAPSAISTLRNVSNGSSNMSSETDQQGIPSGGGATLQPSAELAKPLKSPGTSRIAKLRAAWSPKAKPNALVPLSVALSDSPSSTPTNGGAGTGTSPAPPTPSASTKQLRESRSSKSFGSSSGGGGAGVVGGPFKQRVSVAEIGSPTLVRYTTTNEHGQVVEYDSGASGVAALSQAMSLTPLRGHHGGVVVGAGKTGGASPAASAAASSSAAANRGAVAIAALPDGGARLGEMGLGPSTTNLRARRYTSVESLRSPLSNLGASAATAAAAQCSPPSASGAAPDSPTTQLTLGGAPAPLSPPYQQQQTLAQAYAQQAQTTPTPVPVSPTMSTSTTTRSPFARLRRTRERSATQGEYSSPFKDHQMHYALGSRTSTAEDVGSISPFSSWSRSGPGGAAANWRAALDPVAEMQGLEKGRGASPPAPPPPPRSTSQVMSGGLASVMTPSSSSADVLQQSTVSSGSVQSLLRASPTEEDLSPGRAIEQAPSLPTMWSQRTDISGYTASSESGYPVPDTLGLVMARQQQKQQPAIPPTEDTVEEAGVVNDEGGSDTSGSRTSHSQSHSQSHSTPTLGNTPSTFATASIPPSPVSIGRDHAFGSTAPRSPVHLRKVHHHHHGHKHVTASQNPSHNNIDARRGLGRQSLESPSLDQILPDVEMQTFGTPMPDADFEAELVQAEQMRIQRAPSPFGNNMLGLSSEGAVVGRLSSSPLDEDSSAVLSSGRLAANDPAVAVQRQQQQTPTSTSEVVPGCNMSRTSMASTSTASRSHKKYAFDMVVSPQQRRLILEEEEDEEEDWGCRGLQSDCHACGPMPSMSTTDQLSSPMGKQQQQQQLLHAQGGPFSRFSVSDIDEHECSSIYELSSVEGSADGHAAVEDTQVDTAPSERHLSRAPTVSQSASGGSSSGWDVSSERAIFGLYEDSHTESGPESKRSLADSSPVRVVDKMSKRDTVESLLVRAADLLTADRTLTSAEPLNSSTASGLASDTAVGEVAKEDEELDVDVEFIPEGFEPTGPIDPLTGMVTMQLKWKVLVRKRNGSVVAAKQGSSGMCKVISGISQLTSPVSLCTSLPSPENQLINFPSLSSVAMASPRGSEEREASLAAGGAVGQPSQRFSNPFRTVQSRHSSLGDVKTPHTSPWPAIQLPPASSFSDAEEGDADHAGAHSLPPSPIFCPKPLLLVQNSEGRSSGPRKRFESNAESVTASASPASKASSEFSRPSVYRSAGSATSSPAMDIGAGGGRRRQLSYISIGRGSLDRPRVPSAGARSPFLATTTTTPMYSHQPAAQAQQPPSSPSYVEDSSITPRSQHHLQSLEQQQQQQQRIQTASLNTASGRLAAITGGGL
ncbi:hypothetical protein V8E36_008600 [Tilletia maclaganii]